ncbi:MAG: prephenate dehydratase [Tepidiforma sp.]|jgi:prephenate dehydratase|uniref:Prephenate dehydratase n=1 Tax=Tepidiforma bonchosmolovskayae TaxID=2601677 RepID=A0ABX6BYG2_9CHLR|nr:MULTISPECIES: prephenate dehydratase [Tepidiforma]QFG01763.1 prephenate dehydratase [Tepidiforma bonchosmolovskayae]GIW15572.1 MAG: prephenate dehydratase [Tepidiforma sp.]
MTRIAYLGPPGTFGELAAMQYDPAAELMPFPSHAAVAAAVESGMADLGVVAIENLINGSVQETLDILIHETDLQIQAELVVPVRHNLVAKPGTRPADVRVIYSHPQALGQCRKFLERCFPHAQAEAALSTTEAVELALRRNGDAAAIATERAAQLLGAEVLARDIQDSENNVTRFLVLGRGLPAPTGRDRTSIAFTFAEDRPGALASVLNAFAAANINCTKIESRPTKATFGEYVFLIDFEGHQQDPAVRDVLERIRPLCAELKVFGSYPRAL